MEAPKFQFNEYSNSEIFIGSWGLVPGLEISEYSHWVYMLIVGMLG